MTFYSLEIPSLIIRSKFKSLCLELLTRYHVTKIKDLFLRKGDKMKNDTKDPKAKSNKVEDDIYLEERIVIPYQETESSFSWRKLWLFTGPGWLSKF